MREMRDPGCDNEGVSPTPAQQAQAAQVSSWGNTLTGLTNVYDPSTGTQFQVFSGPKSNYYVNGLGDKINSNVNPGYGFHQVQEVGP